MRGLGSTKTYSITYRVVAGLMLIEKLFEDNLAVLYLPNAYFIKLNPPPVARRQVKTHGQAEVVTGNDGF